MDTFTPVSGMKRRTFSTTTGTSSLRWSFSCTLRTGRYRQRVSSISDSFLLWLSIFCFSQKLFSSARVPDTETGTLQPLVFHERVFHIVRSRRLSDHISLFVSLRHDHLLHDIPAMRAAPIFGVPGDIVDLVLCVTGRWNRWKRSA